MHVLIREESVNIDGVRKASGISLFQTALRDDLDVTIVGVRSGARRAVGPRHKLRIRACVPTMPGASCAAAAARTICAILRGDIFASRNTAFHHVTRIREMNCADRVEGGRRRARS